ncbi:hypothetical protein pb186bvf_009862 [Paramecium bursaria]
MFLSYIIIIDILVISELLLDSQDFNRQLVSIDKFQNSFSIWFKSIQSQEPYDIVTFNLDQENYEQDTFIGYKQLNSLQICLSLDNCHQIGNMQEYYNGLSWIHFIVSNYIKIELPKKTIELDYSFNLIYSLVLKKSQYYRCLIYDRVQQIQQRIQKLQYEKLVRPPELQELFTQQSAIQIFLKQYNNESDKDQEILLLTHKNLFSIQFVDKNGQQLQIDDDFINNIPNYELNKWFQVQFIINYSIIKFLLIVDDFVYTKEYQIKLGQNIPLYYSLILDLQSSHFIFSSSNYYQFYNQNEINLCHQYCKECNITCQSCYVDNCSCLANQFFNTTDKKCYYYSQLSNIEIIQLPQKCQREYIYNKNTNQCEINSLKYEGYLNKYSYFEDNYDIISFSLIEDLNFRKNFLEENITNSFQFDQSYQLYEEINFELLDDQSLLIIKVKNIMIVYRQSNGRILCRHQYFGNQCQYKLQNCLKYDNKSCVFCQPNYILMRNKCYKCPLNCLICNYHNKQLTCTLQIEGYQISQHGLIMKCQNCYFCNELGCVSENEILKQIKLCQEDRFCYQNISFSCNDRTQFIIDVVQQECQYFSPFQLQQVQSLILINQKFLGNYESSFILQLILYSMNSNNTFIFQNYQVSQILRFEQLRQQYQMALDKKLSEEENYFLQKNGYNCKQKYLHNNRVRCIKYDQNTNLQTLNKDNLENSTFEYNLTLQDVEIFIGHHNGIYYQNQLYKDLGDLLIAIQDFGFIYKFVTINASLVFNHPDNYKETVYHSLAMLQIYNQQLPLIFRDTYFFLNISFEFQGVDILQNAFIVYIHADYVQINNLLVYYTLEIHIKCFQLNLINTTVQGSSFLLTLIQSNIVIIKNTYIAYIEENHDIEFNLLQVEEQVFISEFNIIRSQLKLILFQISKVLNVKLYNIKIYESALIDMALFDFIFVQNLQVLDFSIDQIEMKNAKLFTVSIGHTCMIGNVNITQIFAYGLAYLFKIEGLNEASFLNFNIHNSKMNIPQVLIIQVKEQLILEDIYLNLDTHQFLQFQGDSLIINELKIFQSGSQSIQIFKSFSNKILINVLEYKSQNGSINIQQGAYLIQIVSEIRCLIGNVKINNIISNGYGIFYIQNYNFIQLFNIIINNCLILLDNQQINLFQIKNKGRSILYNISIQNISINNNVNIQPTIFRINGTNDNVFMKNITLRNISSNNKDNVIFYLDNQKTQIIGLYITSTLNIKFFYLKSQDIEFSQLKFVNNSITEYVFFIGFQNKDYISYIDIKDLYVYNLTGYLIYNHEKDINYIIQLKDIHVKILNFHTVANILMANSIIQITNILLEEQGYGNELPEIKYIFVFTYTTVFISNISITNLSMRFGFIFKPKKIEMKGIFITNVTLVNYDEQTPPFMSILVDQNTVFSDISIINSLFLNIEMINAYIFKGSFMIKDFKLLNFQLNHKLLVLKFFNQTNLLRLNNFIAQNLDVPNLIFLQSELQYSSIIMNNIFISNCSGYILETNAIIKFQVNNSLLVNTENIFNLEQDISLIIQDSEIINHKQMSFLETPIKNSFIFNEIEQSTTLFRPLGIGLSFDFGKNLLSSRRLQQNVNQISINNNISSFFYLPTGQIINKYQRLQLKELQYNEIYQGFSIVAQGLEQQKIQCNLTSIYNGEVIEVFNEKQLILQEGLNIFNNLTSVFNPYNSDYVQNEIQCKNYSLRFNTKAFRCQLGEFIYNNQCLQCDITKGLYSAQYNSTHCYNVNYNQIEQLKIGLIKLRQNYWRYEYSTIYIEECINQYYCNGGWRPGDSSCNSSRIGAQCQECDIYNHLGNGHFTKNINNCQICEITYTLIYQMLFSIFWQLILTFMNIYSKDTLSKQFLFYKVGFSNFYQVLYRLSIDQPSVILKMFLNYIFQIYLIRQNFDTLGQLLVLNVNYMNNPNLIMQAQLDCLFIQVQNLEVIYTQFFFSLCNLFFILSLQYFIYLVLVKFRVTIFSIKFFFLSTVETVIFNLKIILEISFKLLTYQEISGIKWITSNLSYKYHSTMHVTWMVNYIIPITCTVILAPILIIFLLRLNSNIYRKIQKTFSLFQQAYKNNFFFWEYIIIYVKLIFILISIINKEQLQFTTFLCLGLLFILYHQQPYYLKNLNNIDYRLLLFFTIITQILIITNATIVRSLIFFINIYIIIDVIRNIVRKSIQLNRSIIFDYKSKVTNKFPKLRKFSGLESDLRTISNQKLIKSVIRKKYLSRKNSEVQIKSLIPKHETLSQANEIELGTIKSAISE